MKIKIEWRHLVYNSMTCERCAQTGKNINKVIEKFKGKADIDFVDVQLTKESIQQSNLVLINDRPLEEILGDMKVSENDCPSCSSLIQESTCCRTLVDQKGEVFEEVSLDLLTKALNKILESEKQESSCCCESQCCSSGKASHSSDLKAKLFFLGLGIIIWALLYSQLSSLSKYITYSLFAIPQGTHLGDSVEFFLYDVPKVLMLLVLIVFFVGVIQSFFTPERTRKILAGKKEFIGNILAALLGIVTPFCSCSAVPLFIGFVSAGIPLGVTFSFLISAPMVNEVALVLLYGMFGWKVALMYLMTGLSVAILSGLIIGRLKMEAYIEDWVKQAKPPLNKEITKSEAWSERIDLGVQSVRDVVGKVWPYVIAGIAVGALIHGYVPEDFMASIMGKDAWWSVPLAIVIGVPLYSNAAGIIPIVHALLEKGAALGTVLAFMMAVIGLSLPETIILRKVLKLRLIAVFIGVVATGILIVGYLFNAVF